MPLLEGGNIANVEMVQATWGTGQDAVTKSFKTASQVTFTPAVSQGQEKEQRIKNTLMGLIKTEDLNKGYDIELSDQRLIMDMFALIDGGTATGAGDAWTKYEGPTSGSPVSRTAFTLIVYSSDRDTDGNANNYYKWSFPNCKGKPVGAGATDDDFYTIRYTIESRPATGVSALTIDKVTALPTIS